MRHPYDELLRQMEESQELFWRFVHAVAPDKFWEPPVDVYETHDALKIKVELAGARKEDIQVELSADARSVIVRGLRLDGERDEGERTVFHQMEIYTGPFEREVTLPTNILVNRDEVRATYQDGFLVITLPKRKSPPPARMNIVVKE